MTTNRRSTGPSPSATFRPGLLLVALTLGSGGIDGIRAQSDAAWLDLVQMPVAVARLDIAGVPLAGISLLVPALNEPDLDPGGFLDAVRGIPVLWGPDRDDEDFRERGGEGMGEFVQAMHARGLRGRALAEAIHQELRRRGVPAGPKKEGRHDVLARDWVPDAWVPEAFRDDDLFVDRPGGRRGGGPPAGRGRGRLFDRGGDGPGNGPGRVRGSGRQSGPPGASGRGSGGRPDDAGRRGRGRGNSGGNGNGNNGNNGNGNAGNGNNGNGNGNGGAR